MVIRRAGVISIVNEDEGVFAIAGVLSTARQFPIKIVNEEDNDDGRMESPHALTTVEPNERDVTMVAANVHDLVVQASIGELTKINKR